MNLFEKDYAVQVCDIGSNNQLSNYGLMRILQEAASVHSDVLGMSVNNKHITHMCWIIINWRVKILKRLPWNKIVHVKTWPSITDKLYSQRDFE
ncbi:MAG: hypothetical protein LBL91_01285, partial [Lachnospiraceae bacterium]|nr:hypothetical protein [Lachnospiraceae bacterium]